MVPRLKKKKKIPVYIVLATTSSGASVISRLSGRMNSLDHLANHEVENSFMIVITQFDVCVKADLDPKAQPTIDLQRGRRHEPFS